MHKFLLVDDEKSLTRIFGELLERTYPGAEVRSAPSNPEAVRILESFEPDLVITDFHHYGGTGTDLLSVLRLDPKTQRVPVILLSATVNLERENYPSGFNAVLPKPVRLDVLRDVVNRLLKLSAGPATSEEGGHRLTRDEARQMAESHLAALQEEGRFRDASGIGEVVRIGEVQVQAPRLYNTPLEGRWIAYLKMPLRGLQSSTILVIDDATGDLVYSGSANDEG